jgi:hypothetical protein
LSCVAAPTGLTIFHKPAQGSCPGFTHAACTAQLSLAHEPAGTEQKGVYIHSVNCVPGLQAWIAEDVDYGAIFVDRGAMASSRSARNMVYFFARQFAGAHAGQYSVRNDLVLFSEHDLLLHQ